MIKPYQAKLSGPLLDRIDIHVDVPQVDYDKLMDDTVAESTELIKERVDRTRQRQKERFADLPHIFANGDMSVSEIQKFCHLQSDVQQLLYRTQNATQCAFVSSGFKTQSHNC